MRRSDEATAMPSLEPFATAAGHLAAELDWIELLLQRRVVEVSRTRGPGERFDEFAGLYVSEQEIARYLEPRETGAAQPLEPDPRLVHLGARLDARRQELATLEAAGRESRLSRVVRRFGLDEFERLVLLCCLAPDADLRFQRYYAYLQNDVARRRPTLQLLDRLCSGAAPRFLDARQRLSPDSTLLRERLLSCRDDGPYPARQPLVAEVIADYLVGHDRLDPALAGVASLRDPDGRLPAERFYRQHQDIVERLGSAIPDRMPLCYVWGPAGCGKALVADRLAQRVEARVLRVDCRAWLEAGGAPAEALALLRRDARLHGCLLYFARCEALVDKGPSPVSAALETFLRDHQAAGIVLTGTASSDAVRGVLPALALAFEITRPSMAERAELWDAALGARGVRLDPADSDRLAVSFRFNPSQIRRVLDGAAQTPADFAAILDRCREISPHPTHGLAQRLRPRRRPEDLVVPPDTRAQIDEICAAIRNRRTVYEAWGFERRLALGPGLNVLFAGPSGTGKTMSVEIIAADLGLDLFKVDLSCVVSKYIGETEKNLSHVFEAAESANGILFFDEADALFGRRTEVKDSHDRYANIEVNYLLQRMEAYEGVVVLATNFKSNLDPAFTRRLHHVVEFPFPDEADRGRIWRKVFPAEAPMGEDVDFGFLARQLHFAGGNIRNVALNAAFLAATNGGRIGMKHLVLAARREFQKMGRTWSKSDFGRYYPWVVAAGAPADGRG